MTYILNIGLAREGQENLKPLNVLRAVKNFGFPVASAAVYPSDTEQALVVSVPAGSVLHHHFLRDVAALADTLGQDCVAVYYTATGKGQLIGPRAEKWGEFNPEYFLLLDGTRLSVKTT